MKNGYARIDSESEDMKKNWQLWVEKIRVATQTILPESNVTSIKEEHGKDFIITIIIESKHLPSEKFMLNTIINELFKKSELPIYNPFHIILRSKDDYANEITISKSR